RSASTSRCSTITNAVTPRWDTCPRRSTSNQLHLNSVSTFHGELHSPSSPPLLEADLLRLLEELVGSVSSEKGRAIVALSLMQARVKAICPEQSVRLHKGDTRHGGDRFSWKEGLSMRSLDKTYVTPVLRKYDL